MDKKNYLNSGLVGLDGSLGPMIVSSARKFVSGFREQSFGDQTVKYDGE
jgi:hypothetical protein